MAQRVVHESCWNAVSQDALKRIYFIDISLQGQILQNDKTKTGFRVRFETYWHREVICVPEIFKNYPLNTWRSNNAILTSKRRHFDVKMTFWRNNDVIIV